MNGVTTVAFRRERVTGDPDDVPLDQCLYFLYAWGGTFNVNTQVITYHGGNREASSTVICLPSASVCPGEWDMHSVLMNVCQCGCYIQLQNMYRSCLNIMETLYKISLQSLLLFRHAGKNLF